MMLRPLRRLRTVTIALVLAALTLTVSACGGSGSDDGAKTTITVLAAASLTDVFSELATDFEREHPDARVRLSFGGSSDLATQISEGAPADVFASADEAQMARVKSMTGTPAVFATNVLTIVTAPGNPKNIDSLADLESRKIVTVQCAEQVPCGAAAAKLESALGVTIKPASLENSVTDVLTKVSSGQADAGLVYVTDVARAKVEAVPIAKADLAINRYVIAPVTVSDGGGGSGDESRSKLATEFVELVTGATGQRGLEAAGFGAP